MLGDRLDQANEARAVERPIPMPPPHPSEMVATHRDTLAFRLATTEEHLAAAYSAATRIEEHLGIGLPNTISGRGDAAKPSGIDLASMSVRDATLYLRERLERIAAVLA